MPAQGKAQPKLAFEFLLLCAEYEYPSRNEWFWTAKQNAERANRPLRGASKQIGFFEVPCGAA